LSVAIRTAASRAPDLGIGPARFRLASGRPRLRFGFGFAFASAAARLSSASWRAL
jgi:hypothetical protein